MLKWVKSNLETKNLSSKKGGVVVMKGKTKKKPPKAENGTLGNPSSKTSSAPQSTGRRGNESPTYPSSGLPDSGIQAPPYSPMGNRPNSAISSGAPPSSLPSMDKRSSYPTSRKAAPPISPSMGKGPAAQTYPESSGQSQDQNMYYTNDYNYSDEQSYLPDSTHSYHPHAQGVDLPPYSISQDSSQTYGQSSSKYDHSHSFGQSDYKKCASKVPVSYTPPVDTDHQPFEYDTYTKDYASPSHGTHQSSPYFDGSPAHVTGSPASSHGNGPPSYDHSGSSSPLGHSGPTSYCHSGQSSPHDPSRLSPLINHSGPSSPLGHSGQPSPQEYGNSSHASQYPRDDYNSYPQFNEGRQSPNHCSPFTQRYSNGYQESFPKQKRNSYDSSPKTPKGHYNPENVDKSYQVSTPLKHVSKSMLVKKPPRSPKTPVSMPFRSNEAPSPSIAAKALKNSPIEDYTNIVQPLPSKPGPQIPYKERLPKSPKKEIFVTFPDGKIVKQFVDPNMAMMDLLIQLTASKRLNPSGYLLVALSEEGNRPVDYKANQPVGLVNAHRVKLISKERVKTQQISQIAKTTEKQLPFEMTYRLTVNLPHGQKVVRRMSANHPLFELHESVCEEKNLDPNIFVFQLPDKPTSQVNLKYTLQELGLINYELNLVHRAEMDHYMSVPNLSNTESAWMSDQSTIKSSPNTTYVNVPPRGDSRKKRGFFSFLRKDKRGKSSGDLLNNRNNAKSRPASMFSPVTDTFESYLNKPKKSSKKKPAPPPPTGHPPATGRKPQDDHTGDPMQQRQRQQLPMHPPGEVINSGTDQGYQTFQKHSQANSDSSSCQRQRAATEPVPQSYKIETDSVERSDDMNHFSQPSSTKYHYLSDIPHRAPTEDDYLPENLGGKNVTPVSPQGLSVPLKTANDMYASPLKKRKPAPLPPPGGPQVRPKFDILSAAEKSDPDTPNLSNALDRPNSSHSTTVEQMEIANHASRTPLITIKTGHARSLSKVSTASSLGTAEEVTCAFDETIAVAEEALQNELMDQMTKAPAKGEEQQMEQKLFVEQLSKASSEETLNVSPTATTKQAQSKRATESRAVNGSTEGKFAATPPYVEEMNSVVNDRNKHLSDTITHNVALHNDSPKKKNSDIISISSDGSFTTIGTSDVSTNSVHNAEAEVNHVIKETIEVKQYDNGITEIQIPVPQKQTQSSAENEKICNSKTSVIEMEHFQVNGMEIGIEKTAALTKTKIGQQVTVIRPNLETSASLELSRSSSAAELAQYMESPKEELLLTKQDRQGLDYRGSPLVEVQKKLEELKKEEKQVPSKEESPKIMLQVSNLSFDSESEIRSGDIESGPQGNLKKQIEHWQKQLQEHLSDNSNLYTHQEQDKLKQKVDLWNKQLKELNVMDTSGFRLLEQNVLKQQIELWQRKLLAKERQHDGRKKFQEQETEFLKKQIEVWKKKIEVIEKCADLYTTEERDVLQQQIDLWQCQLTKDDNMDTDEKEQNLLKRQIDVWKKNLREKKFAGYAFSQQEQDILKQQLNVWQKQLHCCKTGSVSTKREILKEQIEVWQLQLQDVQRNPSDDSQIEQEILEQQIELWQSKLSQKDNLSEEIMLKQIDIWKQQMDSNRKIDDQYLVQERMIIEKEIQLWNKRLSGDDVECENFIALEQDLLHEKIELCQQKLKNNIATDSPDIQLEQEVLKLQVDLWQQKVSAMQEKKLAVINYKEEEQDILKTQIKLWEDKLIKPSEKNSAVAISERGTELLAREVDLWQRWLDVKKEKKESRIKLKLLDEELQKEQIRLWQGHLEVIKNETLGYTEEERDILMQQIELWQKGLTEKKDGKTIHLAVEQEILKKYIDLWYNKMRRNTASSISEERDDVRLQIDIWKKQLNMYTLDDHPLSHSARQDIINQQIAIWQKKRERCSVGADELTKIESEILQQQIELWQKDLMEYEQRKATVDKEMPKEQIKLLKRTLSQRKKDIDPEILEQEKAIVNRQIDLYQKKLDNGHELDSSDFINDEQKILEEQIDLWHRKLCLPDEGKAFYSESEYDILQKQVSLWHQQLVAIQHRQEYQRRLALQEQNLLKEQINLWEIKLEAFPDPVFMVEEQDAMKDQIELWQQQLEEHKGIILNKTASTPDDPELRKMELMLKSQEEIIQSFKEGLKNLPENLKTRASPPPVLSPPISAKETKPVRKVSLEFPPPPETFRDEDFTAVKLKQTVPKPPPKPPTPPPLSHALANLKKIDQPERPASPVNEQDGILRAVPAVVLKKPALARKPKRKLPEPVLSPREELMLEIKNFAGRSKLKGVQIHRFWTW